MQEARRPGAGGLLGEVIGLGNYRGRYVLAKGSRTVAIDSAERFYQARPIAWIDR